MGDQRKSVWVLEDDDGVRFVIEEVLGRHYRLQAYANMADLATAYRHGEPDLLIADLRLPDGNLVDAMRAGEAPFPVNKTEFLVLSSLDDEESLRTCFEFGATDYLTKPFSSTELMVKVERILKGAMQAEITSIRVGSVPVEVDSTRNQIRRDGARLTLTSKEFQIMTILARGNSIDRQAILDRVWEGMRVSQKTLDVHLHNLRRKLKGMGLGIQFEAPTSYSLVELSADGDGESQDPSTPVT